MNRRAYVPAPQAWHLISLRPQGQHDTLRSAAARLGAHTVALSPWRVALRADAQTRAELAEAALCDHLVFTSPTAAEAAARLLPLQDLREGSVLAVGEGTARVLRRNGARSVDAPSRMDSEGLLALPALQQPSGLRVALITAPGGRGVIANALLERGATLRRVDVYERIPLPVGASTLARLRSLQGPSVLAVSSGEALQVVWPQLPADLQQHWRQMPVVTASERLSALVAGLGFEHITVAAGPLPGQMAVTAQRVVQASASA